VNDGSVASLIAAEVRGGRGTSSRLADAFCGLAPDPDRRSAILALARNAVAPQGGTVNTELSQAWQASEEMLLTYSDKAFVSDAYHDELSRLNSRAVDLEKDHTDQAGTIAAWRESVDGGWCINLQTRNDRVELVFGFSWHGHSWVSASSEPSRVAAEQIQQPSDRMLRLQGVPQP
jgi:hypothetical protein